MDCGVTAGSPAGSHFEKICVVRITDVNASNRHIRALRLRMAAQAQVGIVGDEHFLVDGTMRVVTNRATFAQCFMFKNEWARLVLVALRATLVLLRHGQAASRFEDVAAVRVMAIHAAHVTFDDWMMLRQIEFGLYIQMALKAGVGFFTGIDDEAGRTAGTNMLTARPMAGFATTFARHRRIPDMQASMRTGGKFPDNFRVTIRAGLIADIVRAGNFQRCHDG
jgi:hypothetical protein